MSWSTIPNPKPTGAVEPDGIRVTWRPIARGGGYIDIRIGADISRQLGLVGDKHPVQLMLGSDNNAGKMAIFVQPGEYLATRQGAKGKTYRIAVPRAAGFAAGFSPFTRTRLEVIRPQNGQPRHVIFLLTGEFLAKDE